MKIIKSLDSSNYFFPINSLPISQQKKAFLKLLIVQVKECYKNRSSFLLERRFRTLRYCDLFDPDRKIFARIGAIVSVL